MLSNEDLEKMNTRYGRYLDIDNDGIPYRTIPGAHPTKGAYFTRGSSHDEYGLYTEDSAAYVRVMERLEKKFETAKQIVPKPIMYQKKDKSKIGILFFGTSTYSSEEAKDILLLQGVEIDAMRLRAFPFNEDVNLFIENHDFVFLIEQNRDAQMRTLLIGELDVNPKKLIKVLNYDGMPITADFIVNKITKELELMNQYTAETLSI